MTKEEAIDIIKCLAWHTRPNEEDVEQAIKALEQKPCVPMRDLSEEELKHFAEEMKKVRPQVVEQEPRWIPVSERLPEKEGLYLVSVKNEHDRRYSKTCWFHGDDNWFARQDVIAWMPLPEPYKAETEDKE